MHPLLATVRHNLITATLMVVEVALAMTVTVNALALVASHAHAIGISNGDSQDTLVWIKASGSGQRSLDQDVLAQLTVMPSVRGAAKVNAVPLGGAAWTASIGIESAGGHRSLDDVAVYIGTAGFTHVLGAVISEGRDFFPEEYAPFDMLKNDPPPPSVLVNAGFAQVAWPGEHAVGKTMTFAGGTVRVVGVVKSMVSPAFASVDESQVNIFVPAKKVASDIYALNVAVPAQERVIKALPSRLVAINPSINIAEIKAFPEALEAYFHNDKSLIWLLSAIVAVLLGVTALGISGLSSFWVHARMRSIGIRRALGARRSDIVMYFLSENVLVTTVGIALGAVGSVSASFWLLERYEVPSLPARYVILGAVIFWCVGLLSALGPAYRASKVPPIFAARQG